MLQVHKSGAEGVQEDGNSFIVIKKGICLKIEPSEGEKTESD